MHYCISYHYFGKLIVDSTATASDTNGRKGGLLLYIFDSICFVVSFLKFVFESSFDSSI
jgi:hypothetical protein